jgi:hypothetical protein
MGILVNLTWGDSWRRSKEGLGRVVDQVQAASSALPKPAGHNDPSVDIYIYVPGNVWQHQRKGFRLGTLSSRGRNWLRVMIYVPDDLAEEIASIAYFRETLELVAEAVAARLRQRRPDWPIQKITEQIRSLIPAQ